MISCLHRAQQRLMRLERRSAVIPEPCLHCFTRVPICVTQMKAASASLIIAVAGSSVSYAYACVRSQVMPGVPIIYTCVLIVARTFRIFATT